ncbi:MAG: aryl-sulfate sulfotransferase [Candidatus Thorarchaeota archaeon]
MVGASNFKSVISVSIIILLIIFPASTILSNQTHTIAMHETTKSPETDYEILIQETRLNKPSSEVNMSSVNMQIIDSPGSFESYTLFTLNQRSLIGGGDTNDAVIMSMNGTVIAQKDLGNGTAFNCAAEFINPDTILLGSQWGAALWHLNNDSLQILNFTGHHEYEYNPNNNTVFVFHRSEETIDDIDYRYDKIHEYTMTGEIVWTLDTATFISPDWWCPSHDMSGSYRDITHSNTIYYDAEEDIIYYNSRNTNTFFKIDHSTSEIIWGLGEYGDFDMYNINGNPLDELFYHAHSVEPINNDTFILFDNDYHSQVGGTSRSRILEIKIDEDTMTANESWYYAASSTYYSAGWGDADRLPNGNRIGNFGYVSGTIGFLEVNEQKNIVWRAIITQDSEFRYGSYRLERFRFEPILTHHPDIMSMNPIGNLTWDAFFNYRNKQPLPGNFTLFINGTPVESGDFTYAKYWNPTTLSIDPGLVSPGVYNVTLVISDGYGNNAADSFELRVQNFYVERSGFTITERGQNESLPTWSGATLGPLTCNVSLNGAIFNSFSWIGEDIVLNPDLIDLGFHFVQFELFNGSLKVFNDSFWLDVYPTESPVIEPLQPLILDTYWSDSMILSWNLFDATGTSWRLFVDGVLTAEDTWTPTNHRVDWDVPFLRDGVYNISLLVEDILGLTTVSETTLTVLLPTSPHILSSPGNPIIIWGTDDVSFVWEVFGGTDWMVLKNGQTVAQGVVIGEFVEFPIIDWRSGDWRPGLTILTLVLSLGELSTFDTIAVNIIRDIGDPYADALVLNRCQWFLYGMNALGAPNGAYAQIYVDYENGFVTLDMGENEEIIDGPGSDFTIFARGDEYRVLVSESFDLPAQSLGTFTGTTNLDISSTGFEHVRYVKIELFLGDLIEIDAIEALHYNEPPDDSDPPVIDPLEDILMYMIDRTVVLNWSAFDATPWNYEVYVNSSLVESDWWYGSAVSYIFTPEYVGVWNVTIVLYDAFWNLAVDQVIVQVRVDSPILILVATLAVTGVGAIAVVVLLYRKFR